MCDVCIFNCFAFYTRAPGVSYCARTRSRELKKKWFASPLAVCNCREREMHIFTETLVKKKEFFNATHCYCDAAAHMLHQPNNSFHSLTHWLSDFFSLALTAHHILSDFIYTIAEILVKSYAFFRSSLRLFWQIYKANNLCMTFFSDEKLNHLHAHLWSANAITQWTLRIYLLRFKQKELNLN